MKNKLKRILPLAVLLAAFVVMAGVDQARADSRTTDFETFALGSPDGQQGWSSDGSAGSGCAVYDHEIDQVTSGPASFGTKALRMSNAVTSGCFGDQTFSSSLNDEAGETSAEGGGLSGGNRQTRFEASWEFASTVPNAEQPGLSVVASPDRGDGARMSWVQMTDTPSGLEVNFYDYQRDSPDDADGKFVLTNVASGLDRTVPHTIEITMDFIDGPANDIVTVTVDDTFTHTGTSWEDYFRDEEGNPTRTVDSVLYRTGGPAAPDTQDEGFFIDNLTLESSSPTLPLVVDDDGKADIGDCDANSPAYSKIQDAVDAASSGDEIQVCPGTYPESVNVNKTLTLEGAQAGVDARDPSRTGLPADESVVTGTGNNGETPFTVAADDVTIDGFTVEGNTNVNVFGAGVFLSPGTSGTDFSNNIVQNNIAGLFLSNDSASNQTVIQQNLFQNNNQPGPVSGTGIYTDQFVAGGTLTNVLIEDNTFTGNNGPAVNLASSQSGSQSDIEISSNVMEDNGNGVVAFNTTSSSITRNTITGSAGSQITAGGGVNGLEITENFVQDGEARGIRVADFGDGPNSDVLIDCNNIQGNALAGLEVESGSYTGTLDAKFDWWGSPSGPTNSRNPGGTGEEIVDPDEVVEFEPFLIDGTDSDPGTPGFQCEPSISIDDVTKAEGDSGTTAFDFTVSLNNPSREPVSVTAETEEGTATADEDYVSESDTITFAPGQRSKEIRISVIGDTTDEPDETFTVNLSNPTGATISDGEGVGTIVNDDDPPPGCTIGGTPGDDDLTGTPGDDVICGLGGEDTINGIGGEDRLRGDGGNDHLSGGQGADTLLGKEGADKLFGGNVGDDDLFGNAGNDRLTGDGGKDDLSGGSGNDILRGRNSDDSLRGQAGKDVLTSGSGVDDLFGGTENDKLNVRDGSAGDLANGGEGNDDRCASDSGDTERNCEGGLGQAALQR